MHFEILVEDSSGKAALEAIVPRIVSDSDSVRIHSYKGLGRIPQGLKKVGDPRKRILLDQLPKLLRGYGRTFSDYPAGFSAMVVVVCDLDRRPLHDFQNELLQVLANVDPGPITRFCLAIEEMEAWLLGDQDAVREAYPLANNLALISYVPDSICGTWEILADVVYPGGSAKLRTEPYYVIGNAKHEWAKKISQFVGVENHPSPSFRYFRDTLRGSGRVALVSSQNTAPDAPCS